MDIWTKIKVYCSGLHGVSLTADFVVFLLKHQLLVVAVVLCCCCGRKERGGGYLLSCVEYIHKA